MQECRVYGKINLAGEFCGTRNTRFAYIIKEVKMQVSAINSQGENGYNMSNSLAVYKSRYNEQIRDTSFNSLTPYSSKKTVPEEKLPYVFDSVNQWKNFCHQRILGGKLNIIA